MHLKIRRRKKPLLVIPVGKARPFDWADDEQIPLIAPEWHPRSFKMSLPRDPLIMAHMYKGLRPLRDGEEPRQVTYDPEAAQARLLEQALPSKSKGTA